MKCLDPKEGEVRIRNIRRQGKNFVLEVDSEKDLAELKKNEKIKEAGFKVNGEPNLRDPCLIVRGVDREMEEKDIAGAIWCRNRELFEGWKQEDWIKEFRVRSGLGARASSSRSSA